MEFWFAVIKVAAISVFLVIGSYFFATGHEVAGHIPDLHFYRK
ncbi:L-asparagine permease [Pseudomonas sp. R1-43-08]|nr:L-asparagine permease [Pseudomonas sp. R1-43-08]